MRYFISCLSLILFCGVVQGQTGTDLIQAEVDDLHPTQALVGLASVEVKAKRLGNMTKDERLAYLESHPVPVVIGPGSFYFLIDHHHMSRALLEAGHKKLFVKVISDWSQMKNAEFWNEMESHGYTYLFNGDGKKISPTELPETIKGLKDDPYRSLAYFAREAKAFDKSTTPFAEFFWAAFYKKHLTLKDLKNWDLAVKKAVSLSLTVEASGLPGYHGALTCPKIF